MTQPDRELLNPAQILEALQGLSPEIVQMAGAASLAKNFSPFREWMESDPKFDLLCTSLLVQLVTPEQAVRAIANAPRVRLENNALVIG